MDWTVPNWQIVLACVGLASLAVTVMVVSILLVCSNKRNRVLADENAIFETNYHTLQLDLAQVRKKSCADIEAIANEKYVLNKQYCEVSSELEKIKQSDVYKKLFPINESLVRDSSGKFVSKDAAKRSVSDLFIRSSDFEGRKNKGSK